MALWKPFRGNRADLDAVEKHDGYVYFCIDDGALFFDYADADGILQRKQINAKYAETLIGGSSDGITLISDKNINLNDVLTVNTDNSITIGNTTLTEEKLIELINLKQYVDEMLGTVESQLASI